MSFSTSLWQFNHRDFFALLPGGGRCAYCGACASSLDHEVPLSRGGMDDAWNWVPACRSCNSSKGTREVRVWLAWRCLPAWRLDDWREVRASFLRSRGILPEEPAILTIEVNL